MSNVNLYRCTPRTMREFALDCFYAAVVPFIQGSPGIGKSAIIQSIADELNLFLLDHRLSTSSPEDMSGLPRFDKDGFAYFAPFADLFPLAGRELPKKYDAEGKVIGSYDGWLLFLDEFNSAPKSVQAAAYKLILDRKVGQHDLHENCIVGAAGNLATDRAIVNPLSTAMQSRVIHIEMQHNFEEWLMDVALKQNYDNRIIAYLSQYPDKLMDFNPAHSEKTFCCPRTWEFLNRLIKDREVLDRKAPLYAGTITSGVAADFVQFCRVYDKMPKVQDILESPETHPVPSDVSMRWAVVSALLQHVKEKNLDTIAKFVDRMDTSFRILFYRSVMVRNPELRHCAAFTNALVGLARYLRS